MSDAVCTHLGEVVVGELPSEVGGVARWCAVAWRFGESSQQGNVTTGEADPQVQPLAAVAQAVLAAYVDEVAFRLDGIAGTTRIPPSPLLQ